MPSTMREIVSTLSLCVTGRKVQFSPYPDRTTMVRAEASGCGIAGKGRSRLEYKTSASGVIRNIRYSPTPLQTRRCPMRDWRRNNFTRIPDTKRMVMTPTGEEKASSNSLRLVMSLSPLSRDLHSPISYIDVTPEYRYRSKLE